MTRIEGSIATLLLLGGLAIALAACASGGPQAPYDPYGAYYPYGNVPPVYDDGLFDHGWGDGWYGRGWRRVERDREFDRDRPVGRDRDDHEKRAANPASVARDQDHGIAPAPNRAAPAESGHAVREAGEHHGSHEAQEHGGEHDGHHRD